MTLHHDYNAERSMKKVFRQKRRELTIDPDLSANFSTEELNTALFAVKSGKTEGLPGIQQKFCSKDRRPFKRYVEVGLKCQNCSSAPKLLRSLNWDCKINAITMTASAGEHRLTKAEK
jgi:hypothetical protein